MNGQVRNKRSFVQKTPSNKRPKLDFTAIPPVQDIKTLQSKVNEEKNDVNFDWDDDFSGVVLEKACLLADLSQVINDADDRPTTSSTPSQIDQSEEYGANLPIVPKSELEKLKLECEKLKESLKTKEGEVHILRSQIKQNTDCKLADNLNHTRLLEDIKNRHFEKLSVVEKELESTKTKLQFKDLEVKNLTDRCRHLEGNKTLKLVEPHSVHVSNKKYNFTLSQVASLNQTQEEVNKAPNLEVKQKNKVKITPQYLRRVICPEIFSPTSDEQNIIYTNFGNNSFNVSRLDINKRKKYLWNNLPKQNIQFAHLQSDVSHLLSCDYLDSSSQDVIQNIITKTKQFLNYQKQLLKFLKQSQKSTWDLEDPDQLLLDNEEQVSYVSLKELLGNKKLNSNELSVDCRRVVSLLAVLLSVSEHTYKLALHDNDILSCLHDIVQMIGELKQPITYSGLLVSIIFVFRFILKHNNVSDDVLFVCSNVIKEVIFARPKLNVIREVIILLQQSVHHEKLPQLLQNKSLADSCSLFIDSKFRNLIFFHKDACPLYLLFTQIMGLACLPSSINLRCDLTHQLIKYLNLISFNYDNENWLPAVLSSGVDNVEKSDILTLMLYLCVNDYHYSNINSVSLTNTIGQGIFLLKRIILLDPNIFDNTKFGLLFAMTLNQFKFNLKLSKEHQNTINWIIAGFDKDNNVNNSQKKCKNITNIDEDKLFDSLKLKMSDFVYNC